jgi:hypothetical protein
MRKYIFETEMCWKNDEMNAIGLPDLPLVLDIEAWMQLQTP